MNPPAAPATITSLDPHAMAATAALWAARADDMTASAKALARVADLSSGFTARVRPEAAALAQSWCALTSALAEQCRAQGEAMRSAAAQLGATDRASAAGLERVTTLLGAA